MLQHLCIIILHPFHDQVAKERERGKDIEMMERWSADLLRILIKSVTNSNNVDKRREIKDNNGHRRYFNINAKVLFVNFNRIMARHYLCNLFKYLTQPFRVSFNLT